ncbi:hypothetical protein Tco_0122277 [Tanacetum coccineum]
MWDWPTCNLTAGKVSGEGEGAKVCGNGNLVPRGGLKCYLQPGPGSLKLLGLAKQVPRVFNSLVHGKDSLHWQKETDIPEKDKKKAKNDQTKHGIEKTKSNQSQSQSKSESQPIQSQKSTKGRKYDLKD